MKKLFLILLSAMLLHSVQADLIITGVIDGPMTGGLPKAIELYATKDIDDLSIYGIGSANNGKGTNGEEFALSGSIVAGSFIYVSKERMQFKNFFGFEPKYIDNAADINGNDAIELFKNGSVIDIFGDINDTKAEGWKHTDGWVYRVNNTGPDGSNFMICNWTIKSNVLKKANTSNASANDPFPIGKYPNFNADDTCIEPEPTDYTVKTIYEIQSNSLKSPYEGKKVEVSGVVTANFQNTLKGFYIQTPNDQDDKDSSTSEGLFIYSTAVNISEGDLVTVQGIVKEYNKLTEIYPVDNIQITGAANIPTPVTIDMPFTFSDKAERYEGMLVTISDTLTVSQNYFLGRYGQLTLASKAPTNTVLPLELASQGRLYKSTNVFLPSDPNAALLAAENAARLIVLDDTKSDQSPNPIPYIIRQGNKEDYTIRPGDTISNITGIIDQGKISNQDDIDYRIQPTIEPIVNKVVFREAQPKELHSKFKIASFNVLNYFNGNGLGGGYPTDRGAKTQEEFKRQRTKIIAAIIAMDADIIGLIEIENDGYGANSAIQDLVNGLNKAGIDTYAFVDVNSNKVGKDDIAVGFIYKTNTTTLIKEAKILDSSVDKSFDDGKNRPVLAQTFQEIITGSIFTVAVNHLKSKRSTCGTDKQDGQGDCNGTRKSAAKALVKWLATDPTESNDPDFLIIGDLNAYAKEDPVQAIIKAGYINLAEYFIPPHERYSYVYSGEAGMLDHALASKNLAMQVKDMTIWKINADEPSVINYGLKYKKEDLYASTPYYSSDHDPIIIGFNFYQEFNPLPVSEFKVSPSFTIKPMSNIPYIESIADFK